MLDTRVAQSVIDQAVALGADFAEVFVERNEVSNIATLSDQVQDLASTSASDCASFTNPRSSTAIPIAPRKTNSAAS